MSSRRFAMAAHALALLAQANDGYPSGFIAGSVNTHAVFLRRVFQSLLRAGIVAAREGRRGGYRLARPASRITLADVYRAIEPDGPLSPSPREPNPLCPVGAGMRAAFRETAALAKIGLEKALRSTTVAELSRRAMKYGKSRRVRRRATRARRRLSA